MRHSPAACAAALLLVGAYDSGQELGGVHNPDVFDGPSYSPYAGRSFPDRPLWGDSHLHTTLSFDAGAFGNRLGPGEAYRFARGDEIKPTGGYKIRLPRPLDWLVKGPIRHRSGIHPESGIT